MPGTQKLTVSCTMQDNLWEIRPARNHQEQEEALLLMIQENDQDVKRQEVEKIFASVQKGQLDLKHLLVATKQQKILATRLMVAQKDKTAILWPAACDEEAEDSQVFDSIQDALLKESVLRAKQEGCVQIQTTVEHSDSRTSALYERNGLPAIGELYFMQRPASPECNDEKPCTATGESLKLVPISEGISDDVLGELVLKTYIESADFPELQHDRTAARSLQTHRLQGEYNPEHWFVIEQNKSAAGVLFFSWHSDLKQWELTYMGVIPDQRGKGIAGKAIGKSFEHASRKNSGVFLGVDSRNHYAIRLYESLGFIVVSRQTVHVLQLG